MQMHPSIVHATPDDFPAVRRLFREYAAGLGFDLCFQNFEAELAGLPGKYAEPHGCLLLAKTAEDAVGCVALRPLSADTCEMKRMFVTAAHRGTGLGRRLAQRIVAEGRDRGYAAMRLDTIPAMMPGAVALYRSLGFVSIPAYCENPIAGAGFMELRLDATPTAGTTDPQ